MAAGNANQTTIVQITHVFFLYYTNSVGAVLITVITYWCVLNDTSKYLCFGYFPCDSLASIGFMTIIMVCTIILGPVESAMPWVYCYLPIIFNTISL